eukprot:900918-Rhodomonas_salina.1
MAEEICRVAGAPVSLSDNAQDDDDFGGGDNWPFGDDGGGVAGTVDIEVHWGSPMAVDFVF